MLTSFKSLSPLNEGGTYLVRGRRADVTEVIETMFGMVFGTWWVLTSVRWNHWKGVRRAKERQPAGSCPKGQNRLRGIFPEVRAARGALE